MHFGREFGGKIVFFEITKNWSSKINDLLAKKVMEKYLKRRKVNDVDVPSDEESPASKSNSDNEEISNYEKERLEKIKKNQLMLMSLGLDKEAVKKPCINPKKIDMTPKKKAKAEKKTKKTLSTNTPKRTYALRNKGDVLEEKTLSDVEERAKIRAKEKEEQEDIVVEVLPLPLNWRRIMTTLVCYSIFLPLNLCKKKFTKEMILVLVFSFYHLCRQLRSINLPNLFRLKGKSRLRGSI